MIESEIELVKKELAIDLGRGDLFSKLELFDDVISVDIKSKSDGIFAGEKYFKYICNMYNIKYELFVKDKDTIKKGQKLANLKANKSVILKTERSILNFIQHASGIASKTHNMMSLIKDYNVVLLDTRKTRPGLRVLEKYAVRCGGASNHRMGLDDCIMLKDTHFLGVSNWQEYVKELRKKIPFYTPIEIECDTIDEVKKALECDINAILLDNMDYETCKNAVLLRNEKARHIKLEASGNINENNIIFYAKTGVDAISSGCIIYDAIWLDFSMRPSNG
ncbi:carboxylating nicotinate-nucleotide diphosphorylase [Campylobacter canadensis]|uniref:carboxylating nicotinate-nucleotide diphosphorylase n=1 Tax=Campylobacter canadensis TaxID=449520 RepID=UPI001551BD01|nr:carboxylating nicotinate-nucleotide diphosphorylase [Campylobacter canadensis]MBZ7995449.1 carboxylating nicotinate-nucleotide diphosphorylase [Campylobacter canadensis]MBZ7997247.1 carboxylating nicotinate-nucleotide diphosphorylase [Campylobacter canadensis]MBZ8000788.1 carboxylating nicotinate-nucleotide diphosphorylase [Campylobacter canadensis]MBZ8002557.1 carboxylating nicotinate-nucleotide diphosphorylase [Campylobacter canadensis]MBZ8004010.1 carboxylating nicotinate-nucleotide diph